MTPLEKRIANTPLRPVPEHWRTGVLSTALNAAEKDWKSKFKNLFWPHPYAWGALAACWVVVVVLNFSGPRGEDLYAFTPSELRHGLASPKEYFAALQIRNALLELWLCEPDEVVLERKSL